MAELLQVAFLLVIAVLGLAVLIFARLAGVRPGRGGTPATLQPPRLLDADWLSPLAEAYPQPGPELS